jgi:hypothetical protein
MNNGGIIGKKNTPNPSSMPGIWRQEDNYFGVSSGTWQGTPIQNGLQFYIDPALTVSYPGTGTTVYDLSGNGKNATLVNGVTNPYQSYFMFDQTDTKYISCGNFGSFPVQGTLSFWLASSDVNNYKNTVHSHFQGSNVGFRMEQYGGSSMGFLFGNDAGTYTSHTFFSGTMLPYTWYQITVTWNTSANTCVGYVNGTQVFNDANNTWASQLPSLTLGSGFSSSIERWYHGGIGATMLYNRQLSQNEVAQNYAMLAPRCSIQPVPFTPISSYTGTSFTFTNGGIDNWNGNSLAQFQAAYAGQTFATNTNQFNVVNGIQFWQVPQNGQYQITVAGAGGGSNFVGNGGGQGAILRGTATFNKGDYLRMIVGTRGGRYQYTAGGGGASSIMKATSLITPGITTGMATTPLIMAGAGGGGGNSGGTGATAVFTNSGTNSPYSGQAGGSGGAGGNPTSNAGGWGTSGAGWTGRGGGNSNTSHADYSGADPGYAQNASSATVYGATATHGTGYSNSYHDYSGSGSCVGAPGGFGGGGGGQCNGGGGGAGYSGGGAGGGAGGSWFDSSVGSQTNVGYNPADTNGYITIAYLG